MNKEMDNVTNIEKRLLSAAEMCCYIGMGRNRGIEWAKSIGSERRIFKRCLYDKEVIDRYLDAQAEEAE